MVSLTFVMFFSSNFYHCLKLEFQIKDSLAVLKQKPSRFNRFMHTSLCRLWGPRRKYINEVKPDAMRKIQLEHEPNSCAILLVAKRLAHVNLNQDRDPMSCAKWSVNSTETKYSLKKKWPTYGMNYGIRKCYAKTTTCIK